MATPNYGYEKRQRELAKKRKAEEKKQKKLHSPGQGDTDGSPGRDAPDDASPGPASAESPPPAA